MTTFYFIWNEKNAFSENSIQFGTRQFGSRIEGFFEFKKSGVRIKKQSGTDGYAKNFLNI